MNRAESHLILGIDTGGTYTDGVLLEQPSGQVVASTKALTTHNDLERGILAALDQLLPAANPERIKLAAISTTLATNAIAEGKSRPVGLALLGYDRDLVHRFEFESRFGAPHFEFFKGGHNLNGSPQAPPDLDGLRTWACSLQDQVEAFAVSAYFSPLNPEHEELAAQEIQAATGRPVVLGYQLSSRLNSIQRAATAALNASLLSILADFLTAMQQALAARGLHAPLMVLRSDGALASAAALLGRPVETIHSGPVASAIGGRTLSGRPRALVIDIGGTTTDLALIDEGEIVVSDQGTTVGPYHTAVRSARVRSIGLGGDSRITFDGEDQIQIGPERALPLARLARQDPRVVAALRRAGGQLGRRPSPDHTVFWFLLREPVRPLESPRARQVVDLLRSSGPFTLPALLERLGVYHPLQLGVQSLLQSGVIAQAALTPTDLLHLTGQFAPWETEASALASALVARLRGCSVDQLIAQTMEAIRDRLMTEIIAYLTGLPFPDRSPFSRDLANWFFEESLHGRSRFLGAGFRLKTPLVGLGAPAAVFLPPVAQALGAELVLPEHYPVANAIGAAVGSVVVEREAWVYPRLLGLVPNGYSVRVGGELRQFPDLESAVEYARRAAGEQALQAARSAGALEPHLSCDPAPVGLESFRLRVRAAGSPRLGN